MSNRVAQTVAKEWLETAPHSREDAQAIVDEWLQSLGVATKYNKRKPTRLPPSTRRQRRPYDKRVLATPRKVYAIVAMPVNGVLWWDVNDKQAVTVSPHVD